MFRAWRRGPCSRSPLRLQQGRPCSLWGAPVLQMLLSVIASHLTPFWRMAKPREGDSPSCPMGGAGGSPAREPMPVGHETGRPTTASVTSLRQSPQARAMRHDQGDRRKAALLLGEPVWLGLPATHSPQPPGAWPSAVSMSSSPPHTAACVL